MSDLEPKSGRSKALVGAATVVVALLFALSLLTGSDGYVACAPTEPTPEIALAQPSTLDAVRRPELDKPLDASPKSASDDRHESSTRAPGVVTGIVLDAQTTQPVPDVDVAIECARFAETVRTIADGSFATRVLFPSGKLTAVVSDGGVEVGRAAQEEADRRGVWTISIPIGPTYPIAGIDGLLFNARDWQARVAESALDDDSAGEIGVIASGLVAVAPSPDLPDRDWSWVNVRDGSPPFVRFPRMMFAPDARYHVRLELKSSSVYRKGGGKAHGTIGIQAPVIAATKPFAVVAGWVDLPPNDSFFAARALLIDDIEDEARTFSTAPTWNESVVQKGKFAFDEVVPGSKRLIVWAPGCNVATASFVVMSGNLTAPSVRLDRAPNRKPDTTLALASKERGFGSRDGFQQVRLRLSEGGILGPAWMETLTWAGSFSSRSLPAGEFSIENIAFNEEPVLERRIEHETLPSERAGTPLHAAKGLAVHRFELVDERNSTPFMTAGIAFGPGGSMITTTETNAMRPYRFSRDTSLVWSAWADGRAPVFGSEQSFEQRGVEFVARGQLAPGWGAHLSLRAGDPKESAESKEAAKPRGKRALLGERESRGALVAWIAQPVPGVRVVIDGQGIGVSGPEGDVLIAAPARPSRIELQCDGWRLSGLERIPGTGTRYFVWMKRH